MDKTQASSPTSTPFWDAAYVSATRPDTFGGGKPSTQIIEITGNLPPGAKVLDLGCGDGRNALYLAEQGFAVTAVDVSEAAIGAVRRFAKTLGVTVTTDILDMRHYVPDTAFDLIIADGCLHLIEREQWSLLLERLQAATAIGGYHAITVFTDVLPLPDDMVAFTHGLFHEGELFTLYDGWTIHMRTSYQFDDEHPGSIKHRHALNKLIAQKK